MGLVASCNKNRDKLWLAGWVVLVGKGKKNRRIGHKTCFWLSRFKYVQVFVFIITILSFQGLLTKGNLTKDIKVINK